MNNNIRFILIEDIESQFVEYSDIIHKAFSENQILVNQILKDHSKVCSLMRCFWKNTDSPEKIKAFIETNRIIGENIIYFIDDNWKDKGENHDGSTFYKNFLENSDTSGNVIILTTYTNPTNYNVMQYVCKNDDNLKGRIWNQITNTKAYKNKYANTTVSKPTECKKPKN